MNTIYGSQLFESTYGRTDAKAETPILCPLHGRQILSHLTTREIPE